MTSQPARTLAPPFDKWLDRPEPLAAHAEISGRLAVRAGRTLKEADAPERRAVSSEEIYGAAAHAIKAFARARGWPHHSHEALKAIAESSSSSA